MRSPRRVTALLLLALTAVAAPAWAAGPLDGSYAATVVPAGGGFEPFTLYVVVLQKGSFRIVKYVTSRVTLHDDPPVEKIVARTDPTKYAGGYAIRAKHDPLIRSIDGSRSNVIGLPMELLEPLLRKLEREAPAPAKPGRNPPLPGILV